MFSAGKTRKAEAALYAASARTHGAHRAPEDVDRVPEVAPQRESVIEGTPVRASVDGIGALLGESAAPVPRSRLRVLLRPLRWALVLVLLLGLVAPVRLWIQYQSQHVTSQNAAVRGHLAEIGAQLDGLVSTVAVDVGDRVQAGQVLVQLVDRHLQAEVQEAHAAVVVLQRTLEVERVTIGLERGEIEQKELEAVAKVAASEALTEGVRIAAEDARRSHELRESLYSVDGVISGEVVRDAEAERRTAEARLVEARANAELVAQSARLGVRLAEDALTIRERKLEVLEADILVAQARLLRAEADLEATAIRAPEDGAILRRIIQPGGSVVVGQPILSMWLGADLWVEAWIDEEDLGSVRLGSQATVTLLAFPGREFAGVVDKVGLATDLELPDSDVPKPRSSRMRGAPVVGVRIRLFEPPAELLPGLSAVVAIVKQV